MAPRPRLHPALFFAVVGAGLFLGVGAALPLWSAPPPTPAVSGGWLPAVDLRNDHLHMTAWQSLAEVVSRACDYPEKLLGNGELALTLLVFGAWAGVLSWSVWACLRPARRPPAPGSDPAGR
jgi:hypothetical protein